MQLGELECVRCLYAYLLALFRAFYICMSENLGILVYAAKPGAEVLCESFAQVIYYVLQSAFNRKGGSKQLVICFVCIGHAYVGIHVD